LNIDDISLVNAYLFDIDGRFILQLHEDAIELSGDTVILRISNSGLDDRYNLTVAVVDSESEEFEIFTEFEVIGSEKDEDDDRNNVSVFLFICLVHIILIGLVLTRRGRGRKRVEETPVESELYHIDVVEAEIID
jgi:hypothetical protein